MSKGRVDRLPTRWEAQIRTLIADILDTKLLGAQVYERPCFSVLA